MAEKKCDCTKRTVEICGDALKAVYKYQLAYKLRYNSHITFERSINRLIFNGKELINDLTSSKNNCNDK